MASLPQTFTGKVPANFDLIETIPTRLIRAWIIGFGLFNEWLHIWCQGSGGQLGKSSQVIV